PFMPAFAGGIIANNVQVTFLAFALGITAGLGTLVLLLFNGLHIGATLGLFDGRGLGAYLWAFVLPHGIVELTAAAIAGGAGLLLGSALVLPGEQTRREALVERGRVALRLLVGTSALLVLAGLVEGFVSPSSLPPGVKIGFGLTLGVLLYVYLVRAGRGPGPHAEWNPGESDA
ncbi:MAG: stage II sporulation protein M, partial [Gemmatimonadota bacterium]